MEKMTKKIRYFFDNLMAKGTAVMLAILALVMLVMVLVITAVIVIAGFSEEGALYTLWDVLSTTINAWMPSSEDGGVGYVLMVALSAIIGLFFTSFVIGIVSSAIEDKLSQLRKGNSDVVESGHIILLGFETGKYTLLSQLIMAQGSKRACIVLAESMDIEEMEDAIKENVTIPKQVKLVCRNIDITDPVALKKCSPETAALVVVNPIDDKRTVKTLLAMSKALEECENKIRVVTTVNGDEYMLPRKIRQDYGVTMLRTDDILSRIIAHTCTQAGLANAFMEVFDFEGNEFYLENIDVSLGRKWYELVLGADGGVPVGLIRDGKTILNPPVDTEFIEGDRVVIFEKEAGAAVAKYSEEVIRPERPVPENKDDHRTIMIIGCNHKSELIIDALAEDINAIMTVGADEDAESFTALCEENGLEVKDMLPSEVLKDTQRMEEILSDISHVIILSDEEAEEEDADMAGMMTLLRIKDIRDRLNYKFTITTELKREDNRQLVKQDDITDFIISSDLAAMALSQVAVAPELYDTFHELLANKGNEFTLKSAYAAGCAGREMTVREIRKLLLARNHVLLGYIDESSEDKIHLNPKLDATLLLAKEDKLIVIGERK